MRGASHIPADHSLEFLWGSRGVDTLKARPWKLLGGLAELSLAGIQTFWDLCPILESAGCEWDTPRTPAAATAHPASLVLG